MTGGTGTSASRAGRRALAAVVAALVVLAAAACSDPTGEEVHSNTPPAPPDPSAIAPTVEALNAFALDLAGTVSDPSTNVVVAPFAVAEALAELRAGAQGDTRAAIDHVLHATDTPQLDAGINTLTRDLADRTGEQRNDLRKGEVSLDSSTSLWAQLGGSFEPQFLDELARWFDTGMHVVDIRSDPDAARRTINRWVSADTGGRISEVLARGSVNELSRLVVPTGTSVRAPWAQRFEVATDDAPFTLADGRTTSVRQIHVRSADGLETATGDGWQAVAVPYLGGDLEMVVVVPTDEPLETYLSTVDEQAFTQILDELRPAATALALPTFQFTSDLDLAVPLSNLGLGMLFDASAADLSGITTDEPLSVSRFVTQTFATVDEEGSDADATTVVPSARPRAFDANPMTVDRPFLFAIVDRPTGLIVQMGTVVDPNA